MPSSTVRTFTDPDAYHTAIRGAQAEGIVTERGNFRVELTNIRLDRLSLQRSEESLPRTAYSAVDPKLFGIVFVTSPDQQIHVNGLELSPGEIVVFRAGSEGYNRAATACQWGSIALTHEEVAAAGQAIIGRELIAPPGTQRVKPAPLLLLRLLNLHEAAGHLAKTAPNILTKPEVARAMDQSLTDALVLCLASGEPVEMRNTHRRQTVVMRRLESVLRAKSGEPLYMAEFCAATGVSYPTLRACCQEHLGMSPKRYLWLRRMHLTHRALRKADPETTSVTEIATNNGFWELGRFSVTYRRLFGASPSTTLLRLPEGPKSGESSSHSGNLPNLHSRAGLLNLPCN